MHMLCCLYASTSSGNWTYSPCERGRSSSRIRNGFTSWSFRMKSSYSTTRSLRTGKLGSGSTVTTCPRTSLMNVPHVRLGRPFTFAPHDPQIPIRHDHRNVRVGSTWSLM